MRQHPIGTGPFKFVEFKPNEYIKVTRNPDYWKPDRPYLDGIEYTIIKDPSTADLAFVVRQVRHDLPVQPDDPAVQGHEEPDAAGDLRVDARAGVNRHLLVNRDKPPFDNPDLRRAMALSIDRKAFVDMLTEGRGRDRRRSCSRRPAGCGACRRTG